MGNLRLRRDALQIGISCQTMLARLVTLEDIACCVLRLCSPEAAYETGSFLLVYGGLTAL
jgi:NAD(P)-dependent dehydrogenase (short-subunit alcohol dehydrogenase family)